MAPQIADLEAKTMSSPDRIVDREKNVFLKIKSKLLSNEVYANKFVAVVDGEIVDSDIDRSALVERIYSRFGYIPFYVGQVTTTQKKPRRLPSPRRV